MFVCQFGRMKIIIMKLLIAFILIASCLSQNLESRGDVILVDGKELSQDSFASPLPENLDYAVDASAKIPFWPPTPNIPCPNSLDSFNRKSCPCPMMQSGTAGKVWWQTGSAFENGSGSRTDFAVVYFGRSFCKVPKVEVAIRALDSDHRWNLRVVVSVAFTASNAFVLRFDTWADTRLYWVDVTYIAYI